MTEEELRKLMLRFKDHLIQKDGTICERELMMLLKDVERNTGDKARRIAYDCAHQITYMNKEKE